MKRLPPLSTYSSPSRRAVGAHRRRVGAGARLGERVRGEPLAARELRQEALLLLVVAGELDPERAELLHGEDQAVVAQTLETSSIATSAISAPVPVPPYSSSNVSPKRSCSRKSSTMSQGNSAVLSISAARGAIALAREVAHEVADLALLVGQRVDRHRPKPRTVVHGLDVVAVGVGDVRAVVAGVVVGPQCRARRCPGHRRRSRLRRTRRRCRLSRAAKAT